MLFTRVVLQKQKKGLLQNNDFAEIIKHVEEKYLTSFGV